MKFNSLIPRFWKSSRSSRPSKLTITDQVGDACRTYEIEGNAEGISAALDILGLAEKPITCPYYDCGWCYASPDRTTNAQQGACLSPGECPEKQRIELERQGSK